MAETVVKEIDRETLRTLVRRGGQLVEVLPREEYERVHLSGAVSIPLAMISRHTADRLSWDKAVIVYGQDHLDDLSARAAWRLASLGFTQVFRYTAGKADWLANGLPAEGSAARLAAAADVADMDVPTCTRLERVGQVRARAQAAGFNVCVVVNDALVVLGLLTPTALEKADQTWTAEEAMERDPVTFRLDVSPEAAHQMMAARYSEYALVTATDGKLFGLLRRADLPARAAGIP